ncbi:MAG: head-tail joining protein [Fluviibacter sp.]
MGVESEKDILDFFEVDDFADVATYTPIGGRPACVTGIFDAPQASRNATDMIDITIPAPQFVCRTVDVPNAADGDSLTIRSVAYLVRVVITDGTGVSTLLLEKV